LFVISADPSKAAEELDKWAAGLEQQARQYNELQQQLDQTSATESTQDGSIRVTVDSNGVPTRLEFTEDVRERPPSRLADEVMACMRRAQATLRGRVEELVHTTVSADDPPARNIVAQYQERFPDPAEDTAGFDPDADDRIGTIEDDTPPPAPRPPRPSTEDPSSDDDWTDESPLR
jgi:DNA-binding protein YbaB